MRRLAVALLSASLVIGGAVMAQTPESTAAAAAAVADPGRPDADRARDAARKPQEVLEFIGVKPTSTVVEIAPGGGYWTEILAPYLNDKGTYYTAIAPRAASERAAAAADTSEPSAATDIR